MNIALWVVAGLLALLFIAAGVMKMIQPKEKLAASGLGWVEDFSPGAVKAIGAVDALGGLGLVLPAITGIAPVLVPLAAVGLALTMVGAVFVHARRKEYPVVAFNIVLLVLCVFVAWGRFGDYAF
ncbi:DoxX family protein [Sphaerisporangium aureirubrum]|uniref:DoxX family protein n=1 Tax=Sphaerisporangium aureirubrum TaxID=1544736 RepID=A0ABW1NTJ4_9ACTN